MNKRTKKANTEIPNTPTHTFGLRPGHTAEIVNQIKTYLWEHTADYHGQTNYCAQMNSLLDLIHQSYTEFNSVETPEFKAIVNSLDRTSKALVETDGKTEEADKYMNIVFERCS